MDIITHATAGAVAGVALSGPMRLSPVIILTGIAGALLPDIDAVSLWSGFDKYMAPSMGIDKPGWGIYFRITSYNVCYTKLLRAYIIRSYTKPPV